MAEALVAAAPEFVLRLVADAGPIERASRGIGSRNSPAAARSRTGSKKQDRQQELTSGSTKQDWQQEAGPAAGTQARQQELTSGRRNEGGWRGAERLRTQSTVGPRLQAGSCVGGVRGRETSPKVGTGRTLSVTRSGCSRCRSRKKAHALGEFRAGCDDVRPLGCVSWSSSKVTDAAALSRRRPIHSSEVSREDARGPQQSRR